jgi:hypothetical protein
MGLCTHRGISGVVASWGFILLLAACSTRSPSGAAAPAGEPAIEVRAARGELVLAMAPRGPRAWVVRRPDVPQVSLRASDDGAELHGRDGIAVHLGAGPAGMLLRSGGRSLRVSVAGAGRVSVIDATGVPLYIVDGRTAHDGAGRLSHRLEASGDRLLVLGPNGERLGTVHNLPSGPAADAAGTLLAAPGLDPGARSALAAYLLR